MGTRAVCRELLSRIPILDGVFRRFIWSRVFFPENEMRFLSELPEGSIDVAVDVGAALGPYSWILNRVANQVYAFEPGRLHSRFLNRVNFWTSIVVVPAAVGSSCGRVDLYTPGTDADALHSATVSQSNPVISRRETSIEHVDQVTLDSYFAERLKPSQSVDLLKVDVEGYELEVFKGSIRVLSKHNPLIICEIEARHNVNYPEVFSLLRGLGYGCLIYRKGVFELFDGDRIEDLQLEDDLRTRLSADYEPSENKYINNFVFQHPHSRVKVKE